MTDQTKPSYESQDPLKVQLPPIDAGKATKMAMGNPELLKAAYALNENRLEIAEPILKNHLKRDPFDVAAIRMLAELAARIGRLKDAETLLERAIELSPNFVAARSNLASIQYRQNKIEQALKTLTGLHEQDPDHMGAKNLKAAALSRLGDFDEALALYKDVLSHSPKQPKVWMSYGHLLKTVGRTKDGINAYRKAITHKPQLGEVWWSLANLKTFRFSEDDLKTMQSALKSSNLEIADRFHLEFALGKAYEDQKDYETSFAHYVRANELRKSELNYDFHDTVDLVDESNRFFTKEFFNQVAGLGCEAPDPIFIVGMPRSGSTLIEQILSSHSLVEGTSELSDIPNLAKRHLNYPQRFKDTLPEKWRQWGQDYIARTRIQRKTDKPIFIDKLPNNWAFIGFIHSILPNAIIIDARRHPMACCFSNYKQHFAKGQAFAYDLSDMGHYYREYVRHMAHMDKVLPGRIHRVIHEDLIDAPEDHIRALLSACGLPFEKECLNFHETKRAVRTPSSEQVRKPINDEGTKVWKGYESYLGPLKAALGSVLDTYPLSPPDSDHGNI
jgi:tetratricopeptide (TPR) repeat protein